MCATLKAHQSKKGGAWRIGYKAHIGVDAGSGLVHAVETTAANVSDISQAHALVREDDRFCCADFRLYRYSEAPLRTHKDPHLSSVR